MAQKKIATLSNRHAEGYDDNLDLVFGRGFRSGPTIKAIALQPRRYRHALEVDNAPMKPLGKDEQASVIVGLITQQTGSKQEAERWYFGYTIPGFGSTPAELVNEGLYEALRRHIQQSELGTYA